MARTRNRGKSRSTTDSNTSESTSAASSATFGSDVAQLIVPVGFVKTQRPYTIDDIHNRPPIVFRQVIPFAALRGGFRLASDDDTNDVCVSQINLDPAGLDGNAYFEPLLDMKTTIEDYEFEAATPLADRFTRVTWPSYDRLFRTSLKQAGTDVPFNSFLAVTFLVIELVSLLTDVMSYRKLASRIGIPKWDELSNAYGLSYKLYPKSVERRIESILEVMLGFPAMKGMVHETMRMKAPFVATVGEGVLTVPFEVAMNDNQSATKSAQSDFVLNILTRMELICAILRGSYSDEIAAMKRHMPYTLADCGVGNEFPVTIDPFKTDGFMNSSFKVLNVAGNEEDPAANRSFIMTEDASDVGFIPYNLDVEEMTGTVNTCYTVFPDSIPFGSILSSEVYISDNDLIDKSFAMLTPHQIGYATIPYTNADYTGITHITFRYDENSIVPDYFHLLDAILAMRAYETGTEFYMPYGSPVNVDIDAVIKGLNIFMDMVTDLSIVNTIDKLAQTAGAPVVDPAVHAARS